MMSNVPFHDHDGPVSAFPHVHAELSKMVDPTKTKTLRRRFSGDARKRFRAIRGLIRDAIIEKKALGDIGQPEANIAVPHDPAMSGEDVYGPLHLHQAVTPARPGQFDFPRRAEKVEAFMDWLNTQMRTEVLGVTEGPARRVTGENAWTRKYIQAGYQQGMERARREVVSRGGPAPFQSANEAINRPVHADRVGLLYTRAFEELRGITEATGTAISRVLSEGLAQGRNPRAIARDLNARVTAIGENRARIMARTEVVRAHHVATTNSYREAGLETTTVQAEWSTAGDDRVCSECEALEGRVFSLDEIEGMIPLHPQCRCVALPVVDESAQEEAARARREGSQRPGAVRRQ